MRKLQVPLIVVVLLAVVVGMNTVADMRSEKAQAAAKEREKAVAKAKLDAEAKAAQLKPGEGTHAKTGGKAVFKLPAPSGPADAPVKLEAFVNDTNSCHQASTELNKITAAYGKLVRLEWRSMNDPKQAARSDKLNIGCEAGLLVNGKIEMEIPKNGGKSLVSFRGPAGDKYAFSDVYRAINMILEEKGRKPPAEAIAQAQK